jgi:lantibiotic biosynthesis protein
MNRLFNEKQRYNEFKTYYLTKCYLNQVKHTTKVKKNNL